MCAGLIAILLCFVPTVICLALLFGLVEVNPNRYTTYSEIREDGMWFLIFLPIANSLAMISMLIDWFKGRLKPHPAAANAVYFLPLLSLGLLYFI